MNTTIRGALLAALIVIGGLLCFGTASDAIFISGKTPERMAPLGTSYETVAASQTDQMMGETGADGDYLDHLVIVVTTAASAAVSIEDGDTNIPVFPNSPGAGVGTYVVDIKARSKVGGWEITTGAGSAVIAVGDFL